MYGNLEKNMLLLRNVYSSTFDMVKTAGRVIAIAKVLLLLCLIGLCYDLFGKFYSGQTTVARRTETHPDLPLPDLSFCPGFKRDDLESQLYPISVWGQGSFDIEALADPEVIDSYPDSVEGVKDDWKKVTFDFSEIIHNFTVFGPGPKEITPVDLREAFNGSSESPVRLLKVGTLVGDCYTLQFPGRFTPATSFSLRLNVSQVENRRMSLYFHHPLVNFGLNSNFWPVRISQAEIHLPNFIYDIAIHQKVEINDKSGHSRTEEDFYECQRKNLGSIFMRTSHFDEDCERVEPCFHPSLESVIELLDNATKSNLSYCLTNRAYACSQRRLFFALMLMLQKSFDCPPAPKSLVSYDVERRVSDMAQKRDGAAWIFLYLGDTDVTVEEEYILADFFAVIAAVGGSLGMLVGWSCLDFVRYMVKWFQLKGLID